MKLLGQKSPFWLGTALLVGVPCWWQSSSLPQPAESDCYLACVIRRRPVRPHERSSGGPGAFTSNRELKLDSPSTAGLLAQAAEMNRHPLLEASQFSANSSATTSMEFFMVAGASPESHSWRLA